MEMPSQKGTDVPQVPVRTGLRLLGLSLPLVLLPPLNLFLSQMPLIFLLGSMLLPFIPFLYSLRLNLSPVS